MYRIDALCRIRLCRPVLNQARSLMPLRCKSADASAYDLGRKPLVCGTVLVFECSIGTFRLKFLMIYAQLLMNPQSRCSRLG
jgi:hypothetical protein